MHGCVMVLDRAIGGAISGWVGRWAHRSIGMSRRDRQLTPRESQNDSSTATGLPNAWALATCWLSTVAFADDEKLHVRSNPPAKLHLVPLTQGLPDLVGVQPRPGNATIRPANSVRLSSILCLLRTRPALIAASRSSIPSQPAAGSSYLRSLWEILRFSRATSTSPEKKSS